MTRQSRRRLILWGLLGLVIAPWALAYQISVTPFSGTGTATTTFPAGLVLTLEVSGTNLADGSNGSHADRNASPGMFSPNIPTDLPTRDHVSSAGTECDGPFTGDCLNRGTLTVRFSVPVEDPALHFSGLGGFFNDGSGNQSDVTNVYTLVSSLPGGATLSMVGTGTNFEVVGGTTIQAIEPSASVACDTNVNPGAGFPAAATAGCGSVQVNGVVEELVFNIDMRVVQNPNADGPAANPDTGDAVALNASVGEDCGSPVAPAPAPAIVTDMTCGAVVIPDFVNIPNDANCTEDSTADNDAVSDFPPLRVTDAGGTYSVDYTIAGASRTAISCGWIDFNGNGTFESTEQTCADVSPGQTVGTATWTVPGDIVAGDTDVRLRIGYDIAATQSPTEPIAGGETEDYVVTIQQAGVIDAVDDDFSGTPINGAAGGDTPSVFDNDTLDGAPFAPEDVTASIVADGGLTGVTINPDGTLTVPAGTAPDTYLVEYQICEAANPENCDTAVATVVVTEEAVDVAIENTAAVQADGTTVVLTLATTNNGPDDCTGGVVTDPLPECAVFQSDDCGGSNVPPWTWNVGTLPNGGSASCNVTLDASGCAGQGAQTNTATIQCDQGDTVSDNNSATSEFEIAGEGPATDLAIEKTATVQPDGTTVIFALSVSNSGPDDATGVQVTDPLPECTEFQSDDCGGTNVPPWTWTIGDLASGGSATCNVTLDATGCLGQGAQSSTATVKGDQTDPVPANNADAAEFQIGAVPALPVLAAVVLALLLALAAMRMLRRVRV